MPRTRIDEVADGIFAVLGEGGMPNAAFVGGAGDGVIVVDSRFTPKYAEEMMSGMRMRTDDDVLALLNTHFHCDHVFGNAVIPTDRIVSHERASEKLAQLGEGYVELIRKNRPDLAEELVGTQLRLPTETFEDRIEFSLGAQTLDVRHPGVTAHTDGDITVRVPESKTLIAGDLVFNSIVPVQRDGEISGLRQALVGLSEDNFDIVIPGHGEVGGSELIDQQVAFIDAVIALTTDVLENGGEPTVAIEKATVEFGDLLYAKERIGDWVNQAAALHDRA